ncbi:unnamed protein product [Bursaphelenchus xylophilus]|uniref:(pine wood nematode) hypothetical protein n=1 Tax=Bursaphelenchus xylophilus TaxID=6326 RepID=A0A1I7SMS4_BURXY|nr:unnamed protein product [Bursaphelenchus xylophilus]CAG9130343.1 unnamed protein product [Bursaphelenchus xylophilus]
MSNYGHLIGGLAGGVASTLVCHPLDFLRIRYSADEGSNSRPRYRNYWHAARVIIRAEGVRGLYQGLSPSIIASPLSWGLYFHIYHEIHDFCGLDHKTPSHSINLGLGCVSGALVMAVTNPLWVVKTRLCLQYEHQIRKYRGFGHCLLTIWKEEGLAGYYKGFVPGLLGTVNGSIQFAIYNFLKHQRTSYLQISNDTPLGAVWYLLFSSISKALATVLTFPYQVVRTRLQDHNAHYKGLVHCCRSTYRLEGVRGFYKGMWMATLKQLPTAVITYTVYEYARHLT